MQHHILGNLIQIGIAADTNVVSYFGRASIIKFFKNVHCPFILNISDEVLKLTLPILSWDIPILYYNYKVKG